MMVNPTLLPAPLPAPCILMIHSACQFGIVLHSSCISLHSGSRGSVVDICSNKAVLAESLAGLESQGISSPPNLVGTIPAAILRVLNTDPDVHVIHPLDPFPLDHILNPHFASSFPPAAPRVAPRRSVEPDGGAQPPERDPSRAVWRRRCRCSDLRQARSYRCGSGARSN